MALDAVSARLESMDLRDDVEGRSFVKVHRKRLEPPAKAPPFSFEQFRASVMQGLAKSVPGVQAGDLAPNEDAVLQALKVLPPSENDQKTIQEKIDLFFAHLHLLQTYISIASDFLEDEKDDPAEVEKLRTVIKETEPKIQPLIKRLAEFSDSFQAFDSLEQSYRTYHAIGMDYEAVTDHFYATIEKGPFQEPLYAQFNEQKRKKSI